MSKLIVDNGLEYIGKRETPDSSEFISNGRSSGTNFRIEWLCTDINVASNDFSFFIKNTKRNHSSAIDYWKNT